MNEYCFIFHEYKTLLLKKEGRKERRKKRNKKRKNEQKKERVPLECENVKKKEEDLLGVS